MLARNWILASATRAILTFAATCLFILVADSRGGYNAAFYSVAGSHSDDWTVHDDPRGFSVELPAGWSVTPDRSSGRINLAGPKDEQVVIWPIWAPQGLDEATAGEILDQLAGKIGVDVRLPRGWQAPQRAGPDVVRAIGKNGDRAGIIMLSWVSSARGAAVFLFVIAAPDRFFRQEEESFSRILHSFRVTGGKSQAANTIPAIHSEIHYVSWTDPLEGAFTIQVPEGWSVEGGMIHRNALDPRTVVVLKSPDGAITLSGGDAELPGFVLPNPQWASVFPEGSWYSPGAGIQWQVRRYTPAVPFGEQYLKLKLNGVCAELTIQDRRERPDLAQVMDRQAASASQMARVTNSAGEIAFTCSLNGQPKQGYLLVTTQLVQSGVLNLWYAKDLLGYLASPGRAKEAETVLAHVAQSVQVNPQWVARQQQTNMQVSHIASETQAQISDTIMSSYWNRQAALEETQRRVENSILGTTDVVDPATGERKRIESNSNYYWINNRGGIVGTQTDSTPGLDFRQLTRLP